MNILFDFISLQGYHNGGEEYTRKILKNILSHKEVNVIGLYDSKLKFLDNDFEKYKTWLTFIDIQTNKISHIINKHNIDLFYIGIAQRYANYNLKNIKCRTICTIHDIGTVDIIANDIIYFVHPFGWKSIIRLILHKLFPHYGFSGKCRATKYYPNLRKFISADNVEIVTVSEYTKNTLLYFFPELKDKTINVYYPPIKGYIINESIENNVIKHLINNKTQYLLFLNANRDSKNFKIIQKCFSQIHNYYPDLYLVVTGVNSSINNDNVINVGYVSNSDIEHLYKNAWALVYPSWVEGFGYPPIEAIKYSTPVLCSNVCSMPEVLGDAAIYFSPFYENDLFAKLQLLNKDYKKYQLLSTKRYKIIKQKQNADLTTLLEKIFK